VDVQLIRINGLHGRVCWGELEGHAHGLLRRTHTCTVAIHMGGLAFLTVAGGEYTVCLPG
jgi:hypothetical protein